MLRLHFPVRMRVVLVTGVAFFSLLTAMHQPCFSAMLARQANDPNKASTSMATRSEAAKALPLDKLTDEAKKKITDVTTHAGLFRRMPIVVTASDPQLHAFLIRYPEIVVNTWDLMQASDVTLQRTDNFRFKTSDGKGTNARVELIYGTADTHLYYAETDYKGMLTPNPVRARCVLFFRSGSVKGADGKTYVTNRLDSFIKIDSVGIEALAKALHPLVGATADTNFRETLGFIARMSQLSESNPEGMLRLSRRLSKVNPAVRERFGQLTTTVARRAVERQLQAERNSNSQQPTTPIRTASAPAMPSGITPVKPSSFDVPATPQQ